MFSGASGTLASATVLVVDDGSPDGTAEIAERLGKELGEHRGDASPREIRARERLPRRASGWGIDRGFDACVEMDADLSHEPEALPGTAWRRCRTGATLAVGLPVRSRRLHPQLGLAPAPPLPGRQRLRLGAARTRRRRLDGGVPGLLGASARPDRPRPHPGGRVRVPDRDDLSGQAGRGHDQSRCRSGSSTGWTASRRCPPSSWSRHSGW